MDAASKVPVRAERSPRRPAFADGSVALAAPVAADNPRGPVAPRTRGRLPSEFVVVATAIADAALVVITAAFLFAVYPIIGGHAPPSILTCASTALPVVIVFVGIFERLGGYNLQRLQDLRWQISRIALSWTIAAAILLAAASVGRLTAASWRDWTLAWLLVTPATLMIGRGIFYHATLQWFSDGRLAQNIVVVGAGIEGQKVVDKLLNQQGRGVVVSGIFDDRKGSPRFVQGVPVLGTTDDLLQYAGRKRIHEIIVALPLEADAQLEAVFKKLAVVAADLRLSVEPVAERVSALGVNCVCDILVLDIMLQPLKGWAALCKWLEDQLIASVLLVLLAPLFMIVAAWIKIDSNGPVFFAQERFGFNNGVFRVLKFRTMFVDRGDRSGAARTVRGDPRVTRAGRILRSLSLDELPQLINVLRGEMSLVGPRPHAIAMRAGDRLYCDAVAQYAHRHKVKPGITGWAQVNGLRGEVDTLEKARGRVEYDLYYIGNWSLWLDLKILLITLGLLVSRANAY
jgi:Undecaprenyl-phosphate glucose phosphotransferase